METYTQSQSYKRSRELLEILHGSQDRSAFSQPADASKASLQSSARNAEVLVKRRNLHSFSQPATTEIFTGASSLRSSCASQTAFSSGSAQALPVTTGNATRPADKAQAEALAVARMILSEQRNAQLQRKPSETQPVAREGYLENTIEKLQLQNRESSLLTARAVLDSQSLSGRNLSSNSQMSFSGSTNHILSDGRLPPSLAQTVYSTSNTGPLQMVSANDSRHPVFPLAILTRPTSSVNDTGDIGAIRSLVSYHLGGLEALDANPKRAENYEIIRTFFERATSMCLKPIIVPSATAGVPLLDRKVKLDIQKLLGVAKIQADFRLSVTNCAVRVFTELLCSQGNWRDQVHKWFIRPALMELLTSFVDETACHTCLGNLILISAACTAFDCVEQANNRGVHQDNLVMVLDVITFAVRKLHPECFGSTETEQLRSAALSAMDLQLKKLLNDSSCKPIVKAQITGIQLALDHLTSHSSILALQKDVEFKTSRTRFLRTISGFWKVRMPLALQRMSSASG